MANQDIHEPLDFSEELRTLEPSDLGHADTFNPLFKRLINNDAFLKAMQDALAEEIGVVDQKVMTHEADVATKIIYIGDEYPVETFANQIFYKIL